METRGHQRKRLDDKSPRHQVPSYWERTLWPLQSLYFLLPLLIFYELGAVAFAPEGNARLPQLYAERMLGRFFEWTGVTGYYLPGIATVVVLLCWHCGFVISNPTRVEAVAAPLTSEEPRSFWADASGRRSPYDEECTSYSWLNHAV